MDLYIEWLTNRNSYIIHRTALLSMTLNDCYPRFQGHALFDAEYIT